MLNSGIQIISEDIAIRQIVETVNKAKPGETPFALVVGAGFSHGLVPTARDIVYKNLPSLDKDFVPTIPKSSSTTKRNAHLMGGEKFREEQQQREELQHRAVSFWKKFTNENEPRGLKLDLSSQGLPLRYDLAYQAAFDKNYIGALGDQIEARKFQNALVAPDRPRLNAAHFFLASILGTQPNKTERSSTRQFAKNMFKFQAAFSRLIFTTNFDPFLQVALQVAGRLYFMSDTPDLVPDDLVENQTNAIHLAYVHGSIHRHAQIADERAIQATKERNAQVLVPALKRHGIIVIGYSGWDDVIVEALASCEKFEQGLIWIDLAPNPSTVFKPRTLEVLRKTGACYVQCSAGRFMAKLNAGLVNGLPLLDNPIAQLRQKLSLINLQELDDFEAGNIETGTPSKGVTQIARSIVEKPTIKLAKQIALKGLEVAEGVFLKQCEIGSFGHLRSQAYSANLCTERIAICSKALIIPNLSADQKTWFLSLRAKALFMIDQTDSAVGDWTKIVEMPSAPNPIVWQSLFDRGTAYWQLGPENFPAALDDLTRAINEIPNTRETSNELKMLRIKCFYNRGYVLFESGKNEESISDFKKLIQLDDREISTHEIGNSINGLKISISGLFSRAFVLNAIGESDRAIDDYNQILKSPYQPPAGQRSQALTGRAWAYYAKSDFPNFLQDTEAALRESCPSKNASYNLGLALLANGRDADALATYRNAVKQHPKPTDEIQSGLSDLKSAMTTWLSAERAKPCIELLESFCNELKR